MKIQAKHPLFAYILILVLTAVACTPERSGGTGTMDPWPEVSTETKPWTRWWWLGSDVDGDNIRDLMSKYAEAGLGGVEITPIYGVMGREEHYLDFLSPAWMEMLKETVSAANGYGMAVDMNLGTGWPFGGPQITPEYAAGRLVIQRYALPGRTDPPLRIVPQDPIQIQLGASLEALMAWEEDGTCIDLTDRVNEQGVLNWNPGEGQWDLIAAFCGRTGQQVKRAAPGGRGLTMDHFSTSALDAYLARFEGAFEGNPGVRSFFNDSYEVYNASWTKGFFDAFEKNRGYDLRKYLREFTGGPGSEGDEVVARLKSDYRETMSELLLDNFTRPWTGWSHQMGSLTRNQAHGSPGNLIDLYAAVDIPECEIYGHRTFHIPGMRPNEDDSRNVEPNPMMLKLATSAAHITNKSLVSNETFTWLGEHFKVALSQCKPEVEEAFLAGINHVFYHGIPYSPQEAPWPGWLFYASVHFGPTNSFWPHLEGLNHYITRCQSILQSGQSDNEVLVYWPVYDLWHRAEGLEMQLTVHNIEEWLVYPGVEKMAEQGYSYDFISDALLAEVEQQEGRLASAGGAVHHDVLVVPSCRFMPLSTLEKITQLARQGALVVFQQLPEDVPGLHGLQTRRKGMEEILSGLEFTDAGEGISECRTGQGTILLCSDPGQALVHAGIDREMINDFGLKYTRRATDDGRYYYLVNHSAEPIDTLVPLNTAARQVLILDPQEGTHGRAFMVKENGKVKVRVQLQPGMTLFLRTFEKRVPDSAPWVYEAFRHPPRKVEGAWLLTFGPGGPVLPGPAPLENPVPWTSMEGADMEEFSGLATYTVKFDHRGGDAGEYLLHLGSVHESARVWLNGNDLGTFWSIPYEKPVGRYLNEGENILKIEVANLMANRIRAMDRKGIPWRIFHEINFVNIAYEAFDASDWKVETSGLAGPVVLIPVETDE